MYTYEWVHIHIHTYRFINAPVAKIPVQKEKKKRFRHWNRTSWKMKGTINIYDTFISTCFVFFLYVKRQHVSVNNYERQFALYHWYVWNPGTLCVGACVSCKNVGTRSWPGLSQAFIGSTGSRLNFLNSSPSYFLFFLNDRSRQRFLAIPSFLPKQISMYKTPESKITLAFFTSQNDNKLIFIHGYHYRTPWAEGILFASATGRERTKKNSLGIYILFALI